MKRIIMMCMAVLLMGGVTMAQGRRGGDRQMDPQKRAEQMTERMAKEYSLSDEQKAELLKVNQAWTEKMGERPMGPGRRMGRGVAPKDSCACEKCACGTCKCNKAEKPRRGGEGDRPKMTEEEHQQMKADMEKRRAEMEAARAEYDEQVKKIMTSKQYKQYTKKMQERKPDMPQ